MSITVYRFVEHFPLLIFLYLPTILLLLVVTLVIAIIKMLAIAIETANTDKRNERVSLRKHYPLIS